MLSIADRAEIYRLGTIVGYFEPSDAITWADNAILAEDDPSIELIEVSSAGKDVNSAKMVSLLGACAGEQTPGHARDVFFGLLAEKLAADKSTAESMAHQLKTLRSAYDAPDAVMIAAADLAGPFNGDHDAATAGLEAFLAKYAPHAAEWKS